MMTTFQCLFLGIKPPSSGSRYLKYGRLPVWFRPSEVWVSCQFGSDQGRGGHPRSFAVKAFHLSISEEVLCCESSPSVHFSPFHVPPKIEVLCACAENCALRSCPNDTASRKRNGNARIRTLDLAI